MKLHQFVLIVLATLSLCPAVVNAVDVHRVNHRGANFRAKFTSNGGMDDSHRMEAGGTTSAVLGLNVESFGCSPGGAPCGPQFQLAVQAAMKQRRALLIPAGTYLINQTIVVPRGKGPLRIVGEGKYITVLSAAPPTIPGQDEETTAAASPSTMDSLIHIQWNGVDKENTHIDFSHLTLSAAGIANYSLNAAGLTRSYFNHVGFESALISGCRHGGWIDIFYQCEFNENRFAGLELTSDNNNVVVDSCSFEGNPGMGITVAGGAQVSIVNNVIEGNGGIGILTNAVSGLVIRGNYFEHNQATDIPKTLPYGVGTPSGGDLTFFADIVLNGVGGPFTEIGAAYPNMGVELVGNTFSPGHFGLGVPTLGYVLAAVHGGTVSENKLRCLTNHTTLFMLSTSNFFSVKDLTVGGNGGTSYPKCQSTEDLYPSGFYLHNADANFADASLESVRMDLLTHDSPLSGIGAKGFTYPKVQGQDDPAFYWTTPMTGAGHAMNFSKGQATRLQANDSTLVTMTGTGGSRVYGQWFSPIHDERLNNVPIHSTIWVKALSNETVFKLVLFPGGGAPEQLSSDWYIHPGDWIRVSINGLLKVPSGGQTMDKRSGIGLAVDGGTPTTQFAIGGWGPNLAPVGMNPPSEFYHF